MERMELHYEMMRLAMGNRDLFAPVTDPKKILDIGTGTGTWPIAIGISLPFRATRIPNPTADRYPIPTADIFPECEVGRVG